MAQIDPSIFQTNNLLQALRPDDLAHLAETLRLIVVNKGTILHEPGDIVNHAYFPCGRTIVSFQVLTDDDRAIETALIGREGAVGGIVSQGKLPAYARSIVQSDGSLLRIDTASIEAAKQRSPALRNFFSRYADCLLAQVFQSVACNAAHTIEQRACKWLMAAYERTGGEKVDITQEELAEMLGAGRTFVNRTIQSLRARKILETRRGSIFVCDADQLRRQACSCNELVRNHFKRVLGEIYSG